MGSSADRIGGFADETFDFAAAVIGKKPFKGYTSWLHAQSRTGFGHTWFRRVRPPYHLATWYENLYADYDSVITHAGNSFQHRHHFTYPGHKYNYAGQSPVFTIYVTAQSLDSKEEPQAEIKVMATVERTWDGKINFLDFKWIPSEANVANN